MPRSNTDKAQRHADGALKMFRDAHGRLDEANRLLDQEVQLAEASVQALQDEIAELESIKAQAERMKQDNAATQAKLAAFLP